VEDIMSLSLSTSWNAYRHDNVKELIEELLEMNVQALELNYSMSEQKLLEIEKFLNNGIISISSVHNFCPIPQGFERGDGDLFLLCSEDKEERKKSVEYTLKTIEWAERFDAKAVVLHLGRITIPDPFVLQRNLSRLLKEGKRNSEEYNKILEAMKHEREEKSKPCFEALVSSLDEIVGHLPKGMKLGIENRYHYYELPSVEEVGILLKRYGSSAGYWHDTGHAHVQEVLGFNSDHELLSNYGKDLIGLHLHDSVKVGDHIAPGTGDVKFELVRPYLNEDVIRVIELHSSVNKEAVLQGIKYLKTNKII
jgi:sugar phosphate isomerase/epimerase